MQTILALRRSQKLQISFKNGATIGSSTHIAATVSFHYHNRMDGDARNVIVLADVLLTCAVIAILHVRDSELIG